MAGDQLNLLSSSRLKTGMLAGGRRIQDARDELSALDAAAGDGDLGATLAAGFVHVEDQVAQIDGESVGTLLFTVGRTLASKAASTFGALLGSGLMRTADEFDGVSELSGKDVAQLLTALTDSVIDRGGALPGQRTMVDALDGGSSAARTAAAGGATPAQVLSQAALAAMEGADRTSEMKAEFGRAAWVSERALGNRDAGAVAWAIYLGAMADSIGSEEE